MDTPYDMSNPCFYLHLSFIHDLGVIFPLTTFKVEVLAEANVKHSYRDVILFLRYQDLG